MPIQSVMFLTAKENLRSCIAFSCCISLVSFNLGQFESLCFVALIFLKSIASYFVECPLIWVYLNVLSREGDGTPLQYSCLENPMDGGAWRAAVHGVAKSRTRLSDFTFFSLSCTGKGNGNPLQCSCLENPRDGEGLVGCRLWIAQSQTQLK